MLPKSLHLNVLIATLFLCTPVVTLAQVATDTVLIIEQSTTTQNTTSYQYNHENNRTTLTENGVTTLYPFEDYEITSGTPKLYISLGETPVATNIGTTTTYLHTDHLGGTTLTTNQSGTVTKTLDYYPYGETRVDSGTNTEKTQYIGETYDQSTGLNYLNARYLNAKQGRFMSQDPVHLAVGDPKRIAELTKVPMNEYLKNPQFLNSYSYAGNNPVRYSDPDGKYLELSGSLTTGYVGGSIGVRAELLKGRFDVFGSVGPVIGASGDVSASYSPFNLPESPFYLSSEGETTVSIYPGLVAKGSGGGEIGSKNPGQVKFTGSGGVGLGAGASLGIVNTYGATIIDFSKRYSILKPLLQSLSNTLSNISTFKKQQQAQQKETVKKNDKKK